MSKIKIDLEKYLLKGYQKIVKRSGILNAESIPEMFQKLSLTLVKGAVEKTDKGKNVVSQLKIEAFFRDHNQKNSLVTTSLQENGEFTEPIFTEYTEDINIQEQRCFDIPMRINLDEAYQIATDYMGSMKEITFVIEKIQSEDFNPQNDVTYCMNDTLFINAYNENIVVNM